MPIGGGELLIYPDLFSVHGIPRKSQGKHDDGFPSVPQKIRGKDGALKVVVSGEGTTIADL
jgi:hypothetical protein